MANYPGSAPSFTAKSPGQTITSAGINAIADEVVAIGSALLTGVTHALTTNGQVVFPAAQNASTNANTLDDYEEGTWTPVMGGAGGTSGQTYATQNGRYIKIGKKVTVWFRTVYSAKGTITGQVQLQGLPFALVSDASYVPVGQVVWGSTVTSIANMFVAGTQNATTASVFYIGAAATGPSALVTGDVGNATELNGMLTYEAAA